ncbi:4-aminobutyrate aminotransferase [Colletotrichum sp. SAR11_59]|nr:4-aminobutyrate aminotransferase [Colletotrichum sp. SAR11_59]
MIRAIASRPALGSFPSTDYAELLETGILKAAPKGLNQVFTATTGSDANETAYKAACIWKGTQERGGADFSAAELESVMVNQAPGAKKYSIMSFQKGFHGRLFGSLSTTRSKPIHKLDVPAFDWPVAPFPQLKYPLDQFAAENAAEEKRCLEETDRLLEEAKQTVAAVVVEPVQSEGGDNHASPAFFQGLRELTKRKGVLLIVDEVQTGVGATGKFWAHEHWNLSSPPDMVTFSKKAQAAGFYFGDAGLRPDKPYRQFNTWMGDPVRALLFKAIYGEIQKNGLVEHTAKVGGYLFGELEKLASKYPQHVQNLRGKDRGTFIAWDAPRREEVLALAKAKGVNMGGSGDAAIRLRPMLVFQKNHADIFLEVLESVFKRLSTGATGYIGGTVLSLLTKSHPEYAIRALVRDSAKGKIITGTFKDVEVVEGDLDSADILAREASSADVILHLASTGHLKSVETIHKALASSQKPSHWVQVSGASALAAAELADKNRAPGDGSDLVFNDLTGIADIRSIIQRHPSRAVDNYILKVAAEESKINTALVFPPIIYGQGLGPGNKRSVQVPALAKTTLERKRGIQVGKGLSRWGNVHVEDVSQLFVKLVEKAVEGKADAQVWNENGLYLTGLGEISFGEISKLVATAAAKKGLIPSDDVEVLGPEDANTLLPHGAVLFGTNARSEAVRGKKLLGWAPTGESLLDEIPKAVEREAEVQQSNL